MNMGLEAPSYQVLVMVIGNLPITITITYIEKSGHFTSGMPCLRTAAPPTTDSSMPVFQKASNLHCRRFRLGRAGGRLGDPREAWGKERTPVGAVQFYIMLGFLIGFSNKKKPGNIAGRGKMFSIRFKSYVSK
jgi:hypothetical protein